MVRSCAGRLGCHSHHIACWKVTGRIFSYGVTIDLESNFDSLLVGRQVFLDQCDAIGIVAPASRHV